MEESKIDEVFKVFKKLYNVEYGKVSGDMNFSSNRFADDIIESALSKQFHLNENYDLSFDDIRDALQDFDTFKEFKDNLYETYKKDYAYSWEENAKEVFGIIADKLQQSLKTFLDMLQDACPNWDILDLVDVGNKGLSFHLTNVEEDFSFEINDCSSPSQIANDIKSYYEDFDPEEHVEMWIIAKHDGKKGIPDVFTLVEDSKQIDEDLQDLMIKAEKEVNRICADLEGTILGEVIKQDKDFVNPLEKNFKLASGDYFHFHTSDEGYYYSVYDSNGTEYDGGLLEYSENERNQTEIDIRNRLADFTGYKELKNEKLEEVSQDFIDDLVENEEEEEI